MGCHSLDKITLYSKGDGDVISVIVLCYMDWGDSPYWVEEISCPIVRGCMEWDGL